MNNTTTNHIPELHIAIAGNDADGSILLEQDLCGTVNRVAVHASQVRHMADALGLLEKADAEAQKLIGSLIRHMQVLHHRNVHLSEYLATHADQRNARLSYAALYASASADISELFSIDMTEAELTEAEQGAAHV